MKLFRSLAILPVLGLAFCAAGPATSLQLSASDAAARIFVGDATAKAVTGPNQTPHAAGVRQGDESDDGSQTVYGADGTDLLLSLEKWRAAKGTAQIAHLASGHDRVTMHFENLIAFGVYSVFVADLNNPDSAALLALDGSGTSNTFTAPEEGVENLTVTTGRALSDTDALILIYHSDDVDHGPAPGNITIDAHEQMIAHL